MAADPIAPVAYQPGTLIPQNRVPIKTLDQQDFLRLLVAQMTQQDPLNPKSDLEMIPQMVSFTQLEQSKSMQSDIAQLRASYGLDKPLPVQFLYWLSELARGNLGRLQGLRRDPRRRQQRGGGQRRIEQDSEQSLH